MRRALLLSCALAVLTCPSCPAEIAVRGTGFALNGRPFPYTGVSFFNAIYNPQFNQSREMRVQWIEKFGRYGINVLRIWSQWDNQRGFVDTCPTCTLYQPDGSLRAQHVRILKEILSDVESREMAVELVLFSQESWHDGVQLSEAASEKAVRQVASELKPYRNLTFQVWNEFSRHTVTLVRIIREVDPQRLVSSSPGVSGVLTGSREETDLMDYLTPHTSRQNAGKPWEIGPAEIRYLIARYGKPVVDDEPARTGTAKFGGPRDATTPFDHIVQIVNVWRAGGHPTYHHDMFQMGAGHPTVPPSGIPDPEFSPYHRVVFEFLQHRARYQR